MGKRGFYAEKGFTLRGYTHKEETYVRRRPTRRGYIHGGGTYTKICSEPVQTCIERRGTRREDLQEETYMERKLKWIRAIRGEGHTWKVGTEMAHLLVSYLK